MVFSSGSRTVRISARTSLRRSLDRVITAYVIQLGAVRLKSQRKKSILNVLAMTSLNNTVMEKWHLYQDDQRIGALTFAYQISCYLVTKL